MDLHIHSSQTNLYKFLCRLKHEQDRIKWKKGLWKQKEIPFKAIKIQQ